MTNVGIWSEAKPPGALGPERDELVSPEDEGPERKADDTGFGQEATEVWGEVEALEHLCEVKIK